MREILEELGRWLAADESIALATVVGSEGSSPRPLGSRMAVTASGQMVGSVSGGCVEGDVFREAQDVLAGGEVRCLRYTAVDEEGWEVGLACGGTIDVFVEPLVEVHRLLVEALQREETVGLATRLDGGGYLVAWPDGRRRGDDALASELMAMLTAEPFPSSRAERRGRPGADVFLEVFARPPTLTIVGAVHIAMPLVAMAQQLDLHVRLVDARRTFATRDRFPDVDELILAWPQEALTPETLRPQDALVVLTHDPKFDVPALEVALSSPVGYVGLLGSSTTQEKRRRALRERGFDDHDLVRVHGPVGLDLGGRAPAEIAVAILAEIVAVQNE
jgi:xanthine dehydrogenase accessory factor